MERYQPGDCCLLLLGQLEVLRVKKTWQTSIVQAHKATHHMKGNPARYL